MFCASAHHTIKKPKKGKILKVTSSLKGTGTQTPLYLFVCVCTRMHAVGLHTEHTLSLWEEVCMLSTWPTSRDSWPAFDA